MTGAELAYAQRDKRLGCPFHSFPATDVEGVAQSGGSRLVEDKNVGASPHAYTIS